MAPALDGDAMVVLGDVVGSYGVRGWVKIRCYTEAPENLLAYRTWWLRSAPGSDWRPFERREGRMHSGGLVAALEGIETPEQASALKGSEIAVPRSELPAAAAGEIYLGDLVGLAVVNRTGESLGRVRGMTEHGAHPLLRVAGEEAQGGEERLIPYVPAIIDRVDLEAGTIEVDWGADY